MSTIKRFTVVHKLDETQEIEAWCHHFEKEMAETMDKLLADVTYTYIGQKLYTRHKQDDGTILLKCEQAILDLTGGRDG